MMSYRDDEVGDDSYNSVDDGLPQRECYRDDEDSDDNSDNTVSMMGYLKKNVSVNTACGWRNAAIEVVMRSSIICCLLLVFHILSNVTANWGNFGNTVEYCGYLKQILILSEIWDFTDSLSFVELLGLGVILLLF